MAKTSTLTKKKLVITSPAPRSLLAWYDRHGRGHLPWRSHDGRAASPYHTWIAEIMLQQTTVATVIPYYERFIAQWPTVQALAKADEEDVMSAWAGLGYYSRARNLFKCAHHVVKEHGGIFPSDLDALKALPGIGDYTANAIRAIAFDKPANVVDGNVERVMARVFGVREAINTPSVKKRLRDLAQNLAPVKRSGDYAQALMDLGATICKPRNPLCDACPWQSHCIAYQTGSTDVIPKIIRQKNKPKRHAVMYMIRDRKGYVFLRKRPATGLLANLWELPSTPWRDDNPWTLAEVRQYSPVKGKAVLTACGSSKHVFTHFSLESAIYRVSGVRKRSDVALDGAWFSLDALPAIPTLIRKVLIRALG
jgi:A/G-specific adenine glycosylase